MGLKFYAPKMQMDEAGRTNRSENQRRREEKDATTKGMKEAGKGKSIELGSASIEDRGKAPIWSSADKKSNFQFFLRL